ncbi:uncharacterized [Tachysurus ichikawai]
MFSTLQIQSQHCDQRNLLTNQNPESKSICISPGVGYFLFRCIVTFLAAVILSKSESNTSATDLSNGIMEVLTC